MVVSVFELSRQWRTLAASVCKYNVLYIWLRRTYIHTSVLKLKQNLHRSSQKKLYGQCEAKFFRSHIRIKKQESRKNFGLSRPVIFRALVKMVNYKPIVNSYPEDLSCNYDTIPLYIHVPGCECTTSPLSSIFQMQIFSGLERDYARTPPRIELITQKEGKL